MMHPPLKHHFELLNEVWLEGPSSYLFDSDGKPYLFDSIEEAIAELQDDFDTWAREIRDGERPPDMSWSPDEFMIRCVETGACCDIELQDGSVRLALPETGAVVGTRDYERINRAGVF